MSQFAVAVKRFVKEEDAPTMVEYGLMVAVIAIVVVVGAAVVGQNTDALFDAVGTEISSRTPAAS